MNVTCEAYMIAAIRVLRQKKSGPTGLRLDYLRKNVVNDAGFSLIEFHQALRHLMFEGTVVVISRLNRTGQRSSPMFDAQLRPTDIPLSWDCSGVLNLTYEGEVIEREFKDGWEKLECDTVSLGGSGTKIYVTEDGLPNRAQNALGVHFMDGPRKDRVDAIMSKVANN